MSRSVELLALDIVLVLSLFAIALASSSAVVSLSQRLSGGFAAAVFPSGNKLPSLQGLRGVLALSVVAHHAYCWYYFTQYELWTTDTSIVFGRLADFGVRQFFYISGYLFWRKLMKSSGIPLRAFYLSRFVRIAPVYYFCMALAITTGVITYGHQLIVPATSLISSLLPWVLFSIGGQPLVNGMDVKRIVSGVVWTLALEWLFYLALPFLSWFSQKRTRILHLASIFIVVFLAAKAGGGNMVGEVTGLIEIARGFSRFMLIGFGGGILVAVYEEKLRQCIRLSPLQANWLLFLLYGTYLLMPGVGGVEHVFLLAGFALVVLGADLFGSLTNKSGLFLGLISYDIYLVHGWTYFAAMRLRGGVHHVSLMYYLVQTAACVVVIVAISSLIHLLIERPSIRMSEDIMRSRRWHKETEVVSLPVL